MPTVLPLRRIVQAVVALLAVWACAAALSVVLPAARADLAIIQTRWQIDQWSSGKAPQPGIVAWGKARAAVTHALSITPNDPQLHEHLGYLYASRAQYASRLLPDLAQQYMVQALVSYERAVALRPMDGALWANIAQARHGLLPNPQPMRPSDDSTTSATPTDSAAPPALTEAEQLWRAFDKAMAYGQREPSVQATLANIGFARWAELAEPRRAALLGMAALARPHSYPEIEKAAQRHGQAAQLPNTGPSPTN